MPTPQFALALASVALISPLAIHLFLPAIPAVKAEFAISDAAAQLTFSIGVFAMAVSTLFYGSLSDRYGRRPVLLAGLGLFLAGSALSALASTLPLLIAGRLLQATGAGCATTLVRTIARDAYGQANLVNAIAYLTMFYTLGPMISPLISGVLIDNFGWRAIFIFAIGLGGVITVGVYYLIQETHQARGAKLDALGIVRSHIEPFRHLRFSAFVFQTGFSTGAFFVLATAVSVLMTEKLGRPAAEFGLYFVLFPVGFLTGSFITSRISKLVALETMVLAGSIILTSAVLVQASLLLAGYVNPLTLFLPGFFITLAQGIAMPSTQAGAIAMVPQQAGTAAGIGAFIQSFVAAIMAQFYGFIADGTVGPVVIGTLFSAAGVMVCGAIPFIQVRRAKATRA